MTGREYLIAHFEAANADNRAVLVALESGQLGTHRHVIGDTTERSKALFRARVAEMDVLIGRIHAGEY